MAPGSSASDLSKTEPESSTSEPGSASGFPLMKLPLEIRRHIYSLALPVQDAPLRSTTWTKSVRGNDNLCMALLASNKQVSHEAREVLYGLNSFTVVVAFNYTQFLDGSYEPASYKPFPSTPSIQYIKNWQLDIRPIRNYESRIRAGILDTVEQLAKIGHLQTLKVKIHCFCMTTGPAESLSQFIKLMLQPLKSLHFEKSVTFIAALTSKNHWCCSFSNGRNASCTHAAQCNEPKCLAFVALFDDLKYFLETASVPRMPLTDEQSKWLDLKQRPIIWQWYAREKRRDLGILWRIALDTPHPHDRAPASIRADLEFFRCLHRDILQLALEHEAGQQIQQAKQAGRNTSRAEPSRRNPVRAAKVQKRNNQRRNARIEDRPRTDTRMMTSMPCAEDRVFKAGLLPGKQESDRVPFASSRSMTDLCRQTSTQ
ncbi:hypothetical protein XANCAGTX0491_007200 [Xanthoria calcicola]